MDSSAPTPPSDTPPQQPAAPSTGGGVNGDNSTINGDKPIESLPSNQIVAQKESLEAASVQAATSAAQVTNQPNQIVRPASKDSKGESYDQIRKLGESIEKAAIPDELLRILNDRIARL